jgi:hypothetical protein
VINLTPLKRRALRLIEGYKPYQDFAENHWTLAPSERTDVPTAVYLPDDLYRITGVHPDSTIADQFQRLAGGEKTMPPTIVYELRDVYLLNGHLYKRGLKYPFVPTSESMIGLGPCEQMAEAALASTYAGNRYFGHWMTDDLTLAIVAKQLAPPIRSNRPLTPHQQAYCDVFDLHSRPVYQARCEKLLMVDDVGQNQLKRERYQWLRSRLKDRYPSASPPGVMFLRGLSGQRRLLVNELELAAFLERQGFVILDSETLSVEEMARRSMGAKVVVGVEGSQIIHGLFTMHDRGTLFTLLPANYFNNLCKEYTDCLGMTYAFAIGEEVEGGFRIDLERFARTLDRVYATV